LFAVVVQELNPPPPPPHPLKQKKRRASALTHLMMDNVTCLK